MTMPRRFSSRSRCAQGLAAAIAVACFAIVGQAADVVMIEETWQLTVGQPDEKLSAPQVSMLMSPLGRLDDHFFVFTLNHQSVPNSEPGGMQLQHWRGDEVSDSQSGSNTSVLCHDEETITWTQRMTLNAGSLTFEIVDGESQTWGAFGGVGLLRLTTPFDAANLNAYKPSVSIGDSGVSYAGNRVRTLTLQRIGWETATGEVGELTAPIDIDSDIDP